MNSRILAKSVALLQLFFSLLLLALPFWLQPVCPAMPNGRHMSCYFSAWLIVGIAGLLFILALAQLFLKNKRCRTAFALLQILLAVLAHAIPRRIIQVPYGIHPETGKHLFFGICQHEGMACQHTFATIPWILLGIGLAAFVYLALQFVTKEG